MMSYVLSFAMFGNSFNLINKEEEVLQVGKSGIYFHVHSEEHMAELFTLDGKCISRYKDHLRQRQYVASPSGHFRNKDGHSFVAFGMKETSGYISFVTVDSSGNSDHFSIKRPKWVAMHKTYDLTNCFNAEKEITMTLYRPVCVYANRKNLYNLFICFSRVCYNMDQKIIVKKSSM